MKTGRTHWIIWHILVPVTFSGFVLSPALVTIVQMDKEMIASGEASLLNLDSVPALGFEDLGADLVDAPFWRSVCLP